MILETGQFACQIRRGLLGGAFRFTHLSSTPTVLNPPDICPILTCPSGREPGQRGSSEAHSFPNPEMYYMWQRHKFHCYWDVFVCACVCACCYMYVGKYMCACGRPQLSVSLPQLLFLFTEIRLSLNWRLTARLVHQFAPGPLTLPFIINWFILRMHTWSDLSCKWSSCWAIFPAPNRMWRAVYDIAVLQRQE